MPKTASFCPSCGASATPVEMLGFETDAPTDTREVTFGAAAEGRSRRGMAMGGVLTALIIGGIVAVSGSTKNSTTSPTTTLVEPTTSSSAPETTTSTVPEPTTTTSLPERVAVNAAGPLLGEPTGLELWFRARFEAVGGAASPSGVYRVDLDKGTAARVSATPYTSNGPVYAATVDGEGYHLLSDSSTVVRRDGTQGRGTGLNGNLLYADATGVWVQNYEVAVSNGSFTPSVERRRLDGTVASTLEVPSGSGVRSGAVPHTLVLGTADGRSFLFDTDTREVRPIVGSVLAANGGAMLVVRCGDSLVCAVIYVAADGSEHAVDYPTVGVESGYGAVALSPDGMWMVRTIFPTGPLSDDAVGQVVASNPVTGDRAEIGTVLLRDSQQYSGSSSSSAWTPDGRWLLLGTATGVHAWRPGLDRPILISVGNGVMHSNDLAVGKSPTT
jgi:hypothetical protein